MTRPIVLGAGPAGSVAALLLAAGGADPILIDRDEEVGDAICGGFLSWRTASALRKLGCDPEVLGARQVKRLRLYAGERVAEAILPGLSYGLSRRSLDRALRQLAVTNGAELAIDRARSVASGIIKGESKLWESPAIFLATGKHDIRGERRPRRASDQALGLRVRFPASPELEALVGETIELHLFAGGYAGIVLQEGGSINICLALRKSKLGEAEGDPWKALQIVARDNPHFAQRMACAGERMAIDTIGSVPYGWIANHTDAGLYRLGDQAAVIPSLAGEGIAIALASARAAAECYLRGEGAGVYQQQFAQQAARPVHTAKCLWRMAERPFGAALLVMASRYSQGLVAMAMQMSRI